MRIFARLHSPDDRDANFQAAPRLARLASHPTGYRFWWTSPALNQGALPECVAYSGAKYLDSAPIRNCGMNPQWLYNECQKVDEWAGTPHDGSSVRALFKVLTREGYVSRYEWANDVDTMARWLLSEGPVVMGTTWYSSMMEPDARGFIAIGGDNVGGHAYLLKGVNCQTVCPDGSIGAFRILNSWGSDWGQNGCVSISFKDMAALLKDNGEACMSREVLKSL
jgi:hypothetical protein